MDTSQFSSCLRAQTAGADAPKPTLVVEMNLLLAMSSLYEATHARDYTQMAKCAQVLHEIIVPDMIAVGALDKARAIETANKLPEVSKVATEILSDRMERCECECCERGRKVLSDWLADEKARR